MPAQPESQALDFSVLFYSPTDHAGKGVCIPIFQRGKPRFRTCHPRSHRKLGYEIKEMGLARACLPCPSSGFPSAPRVRLMSLPGKGCPPVGWRQPQAQQPRCEHPGSWLSPHSGCSAPHPGLGPCPPAWAKPKQLETPALPDRSQPGARVAQGPPGGGHQGGGGPGCVTPEGTWAMCVPRECVSSGCGCTCVCEGVGGDGCAILRVGV